LALQDVTWDEYECVREELVDRPGVRVTYDRGRLEIMAPTRRHEAYTAFLARVVYALADHLDVTVESCGSTTWKKQEDLKGTEPDVSFYIASAQRILGDRDVDLNVDPPPDLVIEVDVTYESLTKLAIYATFAVPEIWRYDATRSQMVIYELQGRSYVQVLASRAFPILTAELLASLLDRNKTGGQQAGLTALRQWLDSRPRE
jgi:Uma2 family endonuclease